MSIKKQYQSVVEFLQQNQDKKVKDILDEVLELTISKKVAKVTRKNDKGELEIFCWYHKEWENTKTVEYGKKASTETGLNTFCKIGVNQWTKQQADYKKASEALLIEVAEGKIEAKDIKSRLGKLAIKRDEIVPRSVTLELLKKKEAEKAKK